MKFPAIFALVAAIPIELVNFFVFPFPIDVGLPDNATWLQKAVGTEWILLHYPAFLLGDWADRKRILVPTILVFGYLDTAILLFLVLVLARFVRARFNSHSKLAD